MQSRIRPLFALLLPLLVLSACGDSLVGPPSGFGTFTGRWNDVGWSGYGYAVVVGDSLYVVGRRDINAASGDAGEVRVTVPCNGVGSYQVNTSNGMLAVITGGDAGFFPRATGQMQVTEYDGVMLNGTISLTAQQGSETWRFEAGRFELPVFMSFGEVPAFPSD